MLSFYLHKIANVKRRIVVFSVVMLAVVLLVNLGLGIKLDA